MWPEPTARARLRHDRAVSPRGRRRTGLYISPHLVEPCERIQVDGEPVGREEFVAAFQSVHQKAEELLASGAIDNHPTYFETITAMAHWIFRERQVEIAVLETGMGGRLDATNVVDPLLSVITPIDFDHQQYLGDTIPKIAFEKDGHPETGPSGSILAPAAGSACRPGKDRHGQGMPCRACQQLEGRAVGGLRLWKPLYRDGAGVHRDRMSLGGRSSGG